jgi:F-type H+-transporting ATPase subunit alpha
MNEHAPESLAERLRQRVRRHQPGAGSFTPQLTPREVGTITSVSTGIAKVSGLPGVGFEELVKFPGGVFGIAFNVDEDEIGVVLLGDYWHLHAGDEVERTGRVMDVAVGDGLLGRVIDPLGRPLDGKGPVASSERLPIERPRRPSWTARPSPCRSRPASRSSMRSFPSGAASAS